MYRFASTSTGSSVLLDGLSNNSWVRLDSMPYKNTSKNYPVYAFTKDQNMKAFKFTFNKPASGGNLAIDDVATTYGNQDTIFVAKNTALSANYSVLSGLIENTQYFYRVKASLGSSVSGVSQTMGVKTTVNTKIATVNSSNIIIRTKKDQISIAGLHGDENIQIFSLTGMCIYQSKATSTEKVIPFHQNGIFIIRIQNNNFIFAGKIIK